MRTAAEAKLGMPIAAGTPLYKWMVRHAGWVVTHLRVMASGWTSFQAVTGHRYTRELATMGEAVLARLPRAKGNRRAKGKTLHKGDIGFARGMWLGKTNESDEHIVGLENGMVVTTRTIKRLPPTRRWDRTLVAELRCMPWDRINIDTSARMAPTAPTPAEAANMQQEGEAHLRSMDQEQAAAETAAGERGAGPPAAEQRGAEELNEAVSTAVPATPPRGTKREPEQFEMFTPQVATRQRAAPPEGTKRDVPEVLASSPGTEPVGSKPRVGGVTAEEHHVDNVRPTYLEILRDMTVAHPADATEDQMTKAGRRRHLDGLKHYQVMELTPRHEAKGKKVRARWLDTYAWNGEAQAWTVKSRWIAQEFKWMEERTDLFTPGATMLESRVIDYVALKHGWPTWTADAEDAYFHTPEYEDVWVEAPGEMLEEAREKGDDTDYVGQLRKQLPGRRSAGTR